MSAGALWLMVGIGIVALLIGGGFAIAARGRRRASSRYVSRLAAVMICAVGLILIVFAASWAATA